MGRVQCSRCARQSIPMVNREAPQVLMPDLFDRRNLFSDPSQPHWLSGFRGQLLPLPLDKNDLHRMVSCLEEVKLTPSLNLYLSPSWVIHLYRLKGNSPSSRVRELKLGSMLFGASFSRVRRWRSPQAAIRTQSHQFVR